LVAGWHQLKVARRRVKHPKLAPVPVLQQRAAHRGPKQAEAVRRAVCDVLPGRRDLDDVGPRMYLLAGLIAAGALVGGDDRDATRHRAAEIAAGALDPGSADAVVRHAATRALPALAV
jgi:hypothetical protein